MIFIKNKYVKSILSLILIICILLSTLTVEAQDSIDVKVNNEAVAFDQSPVIENGRTLVPLRAIFESLGAKVEWYDRTKTVTGTKDGTIVALTVGDLTAKVNDVTVSLDVPAKIINGRTMVPVRFIAESLNCSVGWKAETKTVFITDGENKPKRNLSIHYIDVGQADSILIMLPNGQNMLIDAGNNGDGELIVNYIKSQEIDTIDYVIGTHPHEDHIGGLDTVIDAFNIGEIFMPKVSSTTKTYEDVLAAIQNKGLSVQSAKAGINILNSNGLSLDILSPTADDYDEINDYSAVLKLTYLNNSFLFMGDSEEISENQITANVKADVIKIGHHGSDTSTTEAFLSKVSPKYAVISVGKDNTYGHPSQSVLELLNSYGVKIYRTDEAGTIIANSDGNNITIDKNASKINGNAPPVVQKPEQPADNSSQTVYVTKTGTKYHLEGCSSLRKSKIPITLAEARLKYEPCSICNPPR